MPELPEVETVRCGLEDAILGHRVEFVQVHRYDLRQLIPQDFRQFLTGRRIETLIRRGKYIIFDFGDKHYAVLHLGMSGRVRIFEPSESYLARKHDHVVIRTNGCLLYTSPSPRDLSTSRMPSSA